MEGNEVTGSLKVLLLLFGVAITGLLIYLVLAQTNNTEPVEAGGILIKPVPLHSGSVEFTN